MTLHIPVACIAKLCFLDVKSPDSRVDLTFPFMVR